MVEGFPGAGSFEYNFDKAAEELSSKYGLSVISVKNVLVDWKDY